MRTLRADHRHSSDPRRDPHGTMRVGRHPKWRRGSVGWERSRVQDWATLFMPRAQSHERKPLPCALPSDTGALQEYLWLHVSCPVSVSPAGMPSNAFSWTDCAGSQDPQAGQRSHLLTASTALAHCALRKSTAQVRGGPSAIP